jgi:hypothetical protein
LITVAAILDIQALASPFPPWTHLNYGELAAAAADMDGELLRAWQLILELSEQNSHNQKIADALKQQATTLQVRTRRPP